MYAIVLISSLFFAGCLHNKNPQANPQASDEPFYGSFFDLLKRGDALVCSWETFGEGGEATGMTYVAGERLRVVASMTDMKTGDEATFNSIYNENKVYGWNEGSKMGFMMENPDVEEIVEDAEGQEIADNQGQDLNQEATFDCQPWNVNEDMFNPPADVEFQDFTAQMEAAKQMMPSGNMPGGGDFDACAACAQLPAGEARQACLSSCS